MQRDAEQPHSVGRAAQHPEGEPPLRPCHRSEAGRHREVREVMADDGRVDQPTGEGQRRHDH